MFYKSLLPNWWTQINIKNKKLAALSKDNVLFLEYFFISTMSASKQKRKI